MGRRAIIDPKLRGLCIFHDARCVYFNEQHFTHGFLREFARNYFLLPVFLA
jgi:hypothetical protein